MTSHHIIRIHWSLQRSLWFDFIWISLVQFGLVGIPDVYECVSLGGGPGGLDAYWGTPHPYHPPPGLNHTAMRDAQRNTTRTPTWHFQTAPLSPSQDRARCPIPHCGIGQRTIIYIQLNCFCHAHLYIHFYSLPKRRKGFFLLWQQLYQQLSFQTGNMQWNQYIINLFKTKLIFGIPLDVFWDIINMQSNWIFNWIGTENYYFQK